MLYKAGVIIKIQSQLVQSRVNCWVYLANNNTDELKEEQKEQKLVLHWRMNGL